MIFEKYVWMAAAFALAASTTACNDSGSSDGGSSGGGAGDTLTVGQEVTGTTSTKDEYTFTPQQGHLYHVRLETLSGDADFVVYDLPPDVAGIPVASSATTNPVEVYNFIAESTDTHYVEVRHYVDGQDPDSSYKFLVSDHNIQANTAYSTSNSGEEVYYMFHSNGGAFTVDLTVLSGEADLAVRDGWETDAGTTTFATSTNSGSDSITLSAPTDPVNSYMIHVMPDPAALDPSMEFSIRVTQ